MRMMLKFRLDVEAANLATNEGAIGKVIASVLGEAKPEAAFFLTEGGKRTGYVYFDLASPDQIPVLAEPLFHGLGAEVDFTPVMNQTELQAGLEAWARSQR
jgi:hypothetical protein